MHIFETILGGIIYIVATALFIVVIKKIVISIGIAIKKG